MKTTHVAVEKETELQRAGLQRRQVSLHKAVISTVGLRGTADQNLV